MSHNFLNKGGHFHGVFATNFQIWPSSRLCKSWQPSLSTLDIFLVCRGVTGMQSFIRRQKRTWEHHTFEGDFLGYFPSQNQNAVNVCGLLYLIATAKKLYPNALFRKPQSELCIYTIHQLLYTRNCFLSAEVLLQCHLGKKFILQSSGPCINPNLHWVLTIHNRSIVACRVEALKQPLWTVHPRLARCFFRHRTNNLYSQFFIGVWLLGQQPGAESANFDTFIFFVELSIFLVITTRNDQNSLVEASFIWSLANNIYSIEIKATSQLAWPDWPWRTFTFGTSRAFSRVLRRLQMIVPIFFGGG